MSLSPGHRLGTFEITGHIGAAVPPPLAWRHRRASFGEVSRVFALTADDLTPPPPIVILNWPALLAAK